jgi:hypothetical protein
MILFIFVILLFMAGWWGMENVIDVSFSIEMKNFSLPYYEVGISFREHATIDEEYIEQELIVGLFFINLVVTFYKQNS